MKAHELMNVLDTNPTQKFYDEVIDEFGTVATEAKEAGECSVEIRIMYPQRGRLGILKPVHFTPNTKQPLDGIAVTLTGYLTFNGYHCLVEFEPVKVTEFPVGEPEVIHIHTELCLKITVSWRHLLDQHFAENAN